MEERQPELAELRLNRLLVAIDGSAGADLALSAAVTAARRDNAAITLISVAPDVVAEATRWAWPGSIGVGDQSEADSYGERILREAVERIPQDIPVTTVLKRGRVGHEIVAFSKTQNFDAILLGARGVGRVEAMLGSVSQFVMHNAQIAVFVAHAPEAP